MDFIFLKCVKTFVIVKEMVKFKFNLATRTTTRDQFAHINLYSGTSL